MSRHEGHLTRVLRVDAKEPDVHAIREAAAALLEDELVAFPTETVYGLGANALSARAVQALFEAKGRPATDPIIVHVASAADVRQIARDVPAIVDELAARFWPGPLTLVLPKLPIVTDAITAGLHTVGVRVPSHPVAQLLLREAGVPVAAPSANRFSRPSPTHARHVVDDLDGLVAIVLDAGPASVGVESTVLDLTVSPFLVRRPGGVSVEELRTIVADIVVRSRYAHGGEPLAAPGQLLRHYAPRAELTLYLGDTKAVATRMAADTRALTASGARVGILAPEEDLLAMAPMIASQAARGKVRTVGYGARRDVARAARELFAALRTLDAEDVDKILASAPEAQQLGAAIHDRLIRAAEGRVRYV